MERTNKPFPRDTVGSISLDNMFRSLEFHASRKKSVSMSLVIHAVLLTILLAIPLIFTEAMRVHFNTVMIAPPMPKKEVLEVTHYKEPPQAKPKIEPKKDLVAPPPPKPVLTEPPKPKPPEPPKLAEVKLPEVIQPKPLAKRTAEIDEPPVAAPKIEIRTNVFSTGSSAKPTTNLPAAQVQTGGFGDPNGIRGEGKPGKTGNIASLGSFDLPVGPGAGNGTGGARGAKGIVASPGFVNGVATVENGGGKGSGASGRAVHQTGFDAEPAKPEPAPKKRDAGPPQTPVEILFKPKPQYTQEARRHSGRPWGRFVRACGRRRWTRWPGASSPRPATASSSGTAWVTASMKPQFTLPSKFASSPQCATACLSIRRRPFTFYLNWLTNSRCG